MVVGSNTEASGSSDVAPTTLVLGPPDRPFVTVRPSPIIPAGAKAIGLPVAAKTSLRSWLQEVPRLLNAGSQVAQAAGTYSVRFAPEVQRALAQGSASFKRMIDGGTLAVAEDPVTHRVVGLPRRVPGAEIANVAGAVWQVMAIVTAQKFLTDIEKALSMLREQIEAVRAWQKNELFGKIEGNLRYLDQVNEAVRNVSLGENQAREFRAQLEAIERDCLQTVGHLRRERAAALARLENQEWHASWIEVGHTLEKNRATAEQTLREYEELGRLDALNSTVRAVALHLRAALGIEPEHTAKVAREIVDDVSAQEEAVRRLHQGVGDRLPWLKSVYRTGESDRRAQQSIREILRATSNALGQGTQFVRTSVEQLERQVSDEVELIVTIDEQGQVVRAERLLPQ